jgi:hypothetical protein
VLILRKPQTRQPQGAFEIARQWRRIVPTALVQSRRGFTALGQPVTIVGTTGRAVGPAGLASTHLSGAANLERAIIPGSTIGQSGSSASFLIFFSTTDGTADRYFGGFGSDGGGTGNTIFGVKTATGATGQLSGVIGGANANEAFSVSNRIDDGRPHAVSISVENFGVSAGYSVIMALDGRVVVDTTTSVVIGAGTTYNWLCAGGVRRVSDLASLNSNCSIYAVVPFTRALWPAEHVALTRDPWQLFAPRRIFVPITAAGSTLPTLSIPTYVPGSLTTTGFRPRVTATY